MLIISMYNKLLCVIGAFAFSLCIYAQSSADEVKKAFSNIGLNIHETTNIQELSRQYTKNKQQWDAAIAWLQIADIKTIAKGKHAIEGTNLIASVEDTQNANLESRSSESHYHHIDLQVVVSGYEGFCLIDHATSTPNCKWREDVIHYDYDASKMQYIIGNPGTVFLFFPSDWHIAKVQTPFANQTLRVIVIKLDYVE